MTLQPGAPELSRMGHPRTFFFNVIALIDPRNVYANTSYTIYVRTLWTLVLEIEFYLIMLLAMRRKAFVMGAILLAYVLYLAVDLPPIFRIVGFAPYFLLGILIYHRKNVAAFVTAWVVVFHFFSDVGDTISTFIFIGTLVVFCVLARIEPKNEIIKKWDTRLGDISYPLYLNHFVIGMGLEAVYPKGYMTFLAGISLSLLFSGLAYAVVEPPIKRVRNRIRGHRLS